MVINLVCVAAGGATGAVLRYLSVLAATRLFGAGFPFGTLFVNVTGSFLIGIAAALVLRHPALIGTFYGPLLVTGVLGGFTTFSAYSLDAMTMIEGGRYIAGAFYVLGSVVLSLLAVFAGYALARGVSV